MKQLTTQQQMDALIEELKKEERVPRLLLHSCCAPCSSYVLEYLSEYFEIIDFYYNPNIFPKEEHDARFLELKKIVETQPHKNRVILVEGKYDPENYFEAVKGLENEPEGGARCRKCFEMRLGEACKEAKKWQVDYVTTSLTISPLKNAEVLNEVGKEAAGSFDTTWLPSDFKKKGGYQRSIELSREYELYRQNYCGCVFSKRDAERRDNNA